MSLVARTQLVRIYWRDNDGAESWSQMHLSAATSYPTALAFMLDLRELAIALSTAGNIGADLSIRYAENTAPAPAGESDNNRQGVFIFGEDPESLAIVRLPSIKTALLVASGPYAGIAIDQTAPAIAAFVSALASGLAGVAACDPFAGDLGDLAEAYMQQI